jgi:hypothetical protein
MLISFLNIDIILAIRAVRIDGIAKRLQADLEHNQLHDDTDEDGDAGANA